MKAPFTYYGGKARIASKIVPFIPKHTVYVEPFCGSATLLFAKPYPKITNSDHYCEFLNDSDGRVINFFRQLRDHGDELIKLLQVTPYSEAIHKEAKNHQYSDDLMSAYYFFINITHSFSHKFNGGFGYGRRVNRQTTFRNKVDHLAEFIDRMKQICFLKRDAIECIKTVDSSQTFFYCDPPYPGANQGHYKGYSQADFERLIATLDRCEGSAIVSCYDQDDVVLAYDGWTKASFTAYASSAKVNKTTRKRKNSGRTECIYIKQASAQPDDDILKIYKSSAFDCFQPLQGLLV
jgi:DNA adenine methylase